MHNVDDTVKYEKPKWLNIRKMGDEALSYPMVNLVRFAFGALDDSEKVRLKIKMARNDVLRVLYAAVQDDIETHQIKDIDGYNAFMVRRCRKGIEVSI